MHRASSLAHAWLLLLLSQGRIYSHRKLALTPADRSHIVFIQARVGYNLLLLQPAHCSGKARGAALGREQTLRQRKHSIQA